MDPVYFFKSLADDTRFKALILIQQEGELCVCELMQALEDSQPKISRHLALLKQKGLLLDRKQKQWVYYRLNPQMPAWMRNVINEAATNNQSYIVNNTSKITDRPSGLSACC